MPHKSKKKVEVSSEEEEIDTEVIEKKLKKDKRAESSRQNAIKAREAKILKAKEKKEQLKQEQSNKLTESFKREDKPVIQPAAQPEEEDDEEEIFIINPPPENQEKKQRKLQLEKQTNDLYEWMQYEKQRKATKQPKINPIQTTVSEPVTINLPPVLSEQDRILKEKMLNLCQPIAWGKF
jgi:hypothetical protein